MEENLSERRRLGFGNVTVFAVICFVLAGAQSVFATAQKLEGSGAPLNIDLLKYVVSQNPEDSEAWAKLADAYLNLKQTGDALKALREAVRLQPDNFRLRVILGSSLINDTPCDDWHSVAVCSDGRYQRMKD